MKLPISLGEKKEKTEYYLALILRNEKVTSIIFEKDADAIKYVSQDEEYFETTIEDANSEEFLNVLDKVITKAETALPENFETHKTIFGLKENWIEDNKIKKEYLEKLKKASTELNLDPIGFLVFSESIVNLIQKEEGAPVTAILADIGKKFITVSSVRSGKIVETKSSEIHQSASYTVDTLLKHFQTPEVLPSRVILLDSEEEELTQEFISHQWSKSLPFLHLPQVVSLPQDSSIKAMLLGAATQMGTKLLYDSSRIDFDEEPKKIAPEELEEPKPEAIETPPPSLDYVDKEESMEYFGFVENEDVSKIPEKTQKLENIPDEMVKQQIEEIPEETKIAEEKKEGLPAIASLVFAKIRKFSNDLLPLLKKIKVDKKLLDRKFIFIPVVLLFIAIIVLFFFLFSQKANVTILVSPKFDEKTAENVTFSSSSATDPAQKVIASEFLTVSEDGSTSAPVSGKKDVGTQSKGTVTVFNISNSSVSLPSGTTITSPNGLKFTLDKSVSIASASGDAISGINPSTANVTVTASEIGQEYNLPSGTKFSIGSDSSLAAKNDNAFSGGSKKQVSVVSKDDLNKLLGNLPKNLEEKARNDIKSKVTSGKTILPQFVDETVASQSFDKKEGDEAKSLTLKGTVDFKALSYNDSDMILLSRSLFDSSESQISNQNLTVEAKNLKVEKNGDVTSDLNIKAKLLPKLDKDTLSKQIAGSSLQKAKNMLSNFPQVENVQISLKINIPFLPKNLPTNPKDITISIVSN